MEGPETVILTLADGAKYDLGATTTATVTIADNPVPVVTIEATDAAASEVGLDTGTFTFTRVGDTTFAMTVSYTRGGTAANGVDYASIGTSIVIPAGSASVTRTITPLNDATVEDPETVILTLVDGARYDLGDTTSATVTIADAPVQVPVVTIEATDAAASEVGPDTGTFTFTRTGDTTSALTVSYTRGGTAANGVDYASIGTSIVIPAGSASVTRTITPLNDALVEGPETVILTLADGAKYDLGATTTATVTIADNPVPVVTIEATDAAASEVGLDTGTFTFTRVGDTTFAMTVSYTRGGTAANGVDYASIGTSIVIPAGSASVTRTITPLNDATVEDPETVILTLVDGARYDLGDTTSATVTIADNPVDHFLCYEANTTPETAAFVPLNVTLKDQFDAETGVVFEVKKPVSLCTPADKNGEGIIDPDTHLEGYEIEEVPGEPNHVPQTNIKVRNQFHPEGEELVVDTIKPDRLLVPSAKDLNNPVDPPDSDSHNVDHYKCYNVELPNGTPEFQPILGVSVDDQFTDGAKLFDLTKPTRLCNPVDKNGEGIKDPTAHLMCYQAQPAVGQPPHQQRTGIHVNNQFGAEQLDTIKEEEFCVPSEKILP